MFALLERPQAGGVRRRHVYSDVIGDSLDHPHTTYIVVDRTRDRRRDVLTDIYPYDAPVSPVTQPRRDLCGPVVGKAQAIDERARRRQAKQPGPRSPWLRARGYGADFDEAEAQRSQSVDGRRILVEPSCKAYAVWEAQAHQLDWHADGHTKY